MKQQVDEMPTLKQQVGKTASWHNDLAPSKRQSKSFSNNVDPPTGNEIEEVQTQFIKSQNLKWNSFKTFQTLLELRL